MKKSEINLEQFLKDFDKILKLTDNFDKADIEKVDFEKLTTQVKKYNKEFKTKYNKDLDSKE
mgnify:CR=1 FL=1|tara:strand:- start:202 stop:387 length:186 start_codon:yes stop_codon:yes gene_type:complete